MEKLSGKEASDIQNYLVNFNKEIEHDELDSENENGPDSDVECESTKELHPYTSGEELEDDNSAKMKIKSEDEDEDEEFYHNNYEREEENGNDYAEITPLQSGTKRKGAEIIRLGPNKETDSADVDLTQSKEGIVSIVQELEMDDPRTLEMVAQFAEQAAKMSQSNDVMGSLGSYQTVTVVPSDTNPGELSYVLFVSEADGCLEKVGDDMNLALFDMNGSEPFSDTFFSNQVTTERGRLRHVRLTAKKYPYGPQLHVCNLCSYTSTKRYLLSRHMKSHSDDRPYKCGVCERGFKTLASLQNHVNTHTGTRPHPCKECDSCFTTSGELVRHVRYKHTHEKPHKCTECDYASVELSKLKRHMRCHTGERPYQCPHCTYASPDTYKLKRHLRIHTGEKPYECDICQARFTQSNSLKAHKLIHSGNKPVFHCEYCPATCGRKTDLRIHMEKLHSSDNPHRCNRCGKVFLDRYSYKIHLKSHEGEKCFKCDLCNYASISPRHLETHMFVHTDQKPFHCDECDQSFRQKQLLKRHKNIYHDPNYVRPEPKEKPHVCVLCSKAFRHRGNLIRHFALHDPDATAGEKELAMRLGEPKDPGEDQDGEEDYDYLKELKEQDKQVVVFEVIQLPSANNASSDDQTITMMDENTLLLNSGDTEGYSIIEQADDSVNGFLDFSENISDPDDIENISSMSSGNANKGVGFRSRLYLNTRKRQRTTDNNKIAPSKRTRKKPRILKVIAGKEKNSSEQSLIHDIPDEETILQRERELEHAKELQAQKDFEECFGFDDKAEDEDLLSMSNSGYQAFHSSLVQDMS